ncbi:YkvI family membrane protein [Thermicanus aegyptius]|uniref:YkvI family membrane protein n=1 Tax=Thermicanus aegyptius TaxID=94009 RepID=UPI0004914758|nr:hypothetical protein [Thermicanus aegyptius]
MVKKVFLQRWIRIYQVAATYIGTVVGAGFATGQEIFQFFTRNGALGTLAILLSTLLFIGIGYKTMTIAKLERCYSYQEFHVHLFGPKGSLFFNLMIPFLLLGGSGVMLSGMGALFEEQFHLPRQIGILLAMLLVILIVLKGLKGVLWVNGLFAPFILFMISLLGLHLLLEPPSFPATLDPWNFRWILSAILYTGLNLILSQAVLVPLGKETEDASILLWGSLFGGGGLGLMLLIGHEVMLRHQNLIQQAEIPLGTILHFLFPWAFVLYSLVILVEILTTLVGNTFGIMRQAESIASLPPLPSLLLVLLGAYLISHWGFRMLVSSLYPFIGGLGILYIVRIIFYPILPNKK